MREGGTIEQKEDRDTEDFNRHRPLLGLFLMKSNYQYS